MNADLKDFLESCLHIDARKRKMPEQLLKHKIFDEISLRQLELSEYAVTNSIFSVADAFSRFK